MERYAFQIYYSGERYQGFQRQPNGMAIENYLEIAFIEAGYIASFQVSGYIAASRTDTGVNAIANVFSLELDISPNLIYINSFLPRDIIVWAWANVPSEFSPRNNTGKHYRYLVPRHWTDSKQLERLSEFKGRHDFSPFIRSDGAGRYNPVNMIQKVSLEHHEQYYQIDIFGTRFGREQIRKMIGFLLDEKWAEVSVATVFQRDHQLSIRAAPARFLTLLTIHFKESLKWKYLPYSSYDLQNLQAALNEQYVYQSNLLYIVDDLVTHSKVPI